MFILNFCKTILFSYLFINSISMLPAAAGQQSTETNILQIFCDGNAVEKSRTAVYTLCLPNPCIPTVDSSIGNAITTIYYNVIVNRIGLNNKVTSNSFTHVLRGEGKGYLFADIMCNGRLSEDSIELSLIETRPDNVPSILLKRMPEFEERIFSSFRMVSEELSDSESESLSRTPPNIAVTPPPTPSCRGSSALPNVVVIPPSSPACKTFSGAEEPAGSKESTPPVVAVPSSEASATRKPSGKLASRFPSLINPKVLSGAAGGGTNNRF